MSSYHLVMKQLLGCQAVRQSERLFSLDLYLIFGGFLSLGPTSPLPTITRPGVWRQQLRRVCGTPKPRASAERLTTAVTAVQFNYYVPLVTSQRRAGTQKKVTYSFLLEYVKFLSKVALLKPIVTGLTSYQCEECRESKRNPEVEDFRL